MDVLHPPSREPDTSAPVEPIALRVTCAWCGQIIADGPGPESHDMCQNCRAAFLAMAPGV